MSYTPKVEDADLEPKVAPVWFVPFQSIEEDRWRVKLFVREWEKFAQKEGEFGHGGFWCERIKVVLAGTPEHGWERAARVAASIVAWFGYGNGYYFLSEALSRLDDGAPSYNNGQNVDAMIERWSVQNSLYQANNGHGGRTLANLLHVAKRGDNPLTVEDMDTAERLMTYIACESGRTFFRNLLRRAETEIRKKSK
jgi:hypothetical protein